MRIGGAQGLAARPAHEGAHARVRERDAPVLGVRCGRLRAQVPRGGHRGGPADRGGASRGGHRVRGGLRGCGPAGADERARPAGRPRVHERRRRDAAVPVGARAAAHAGHHVRLLPVRHDEGERVRGGDGAGAPAAARDHPVRGGVPVLSHGAGGIPLHPRCHAPARRGLAERAGGPREYRLDAALVAGMQEDRDELSAVSVTRSLGGEAVWTSRCRIGFQGGGCGAGDRVLGVRGGDGGEGADGW